MKKSAFGFGVAGIPGMKRTFKGGHNEASSEGVRVAGTNDLGRVAPTGPSTEDLTAAMQHQQLDDLGKLTPAQRVQRARERQALGQKQQ